MEGSPWTFGRFHLILERLNEGDNPLSIGLNKIDLWIQLHGMATGFMSERVARDVGNCIGVFVESDANNFMGGMERLLKNSGQNLNRCTSKKENEIKEECENMVLGKLQI